MSHGSKSDDGSQQLSSRVVEALHDVVDPEVGVNVVDLGLVYGVEVDEGRVNVRLTMTTPACPLGQQIADEAAARIQSCAGVTEVRIDIVWEPPWTPARMSAIAKAALGWSE